MTTKFTRTLGDLATRRVGGLRAAAFATVALGALGGCAIFGGGYSAMSEDCLQLEGQDLLDAIESGKCAPAAGGLAMRADEERERFGPEEHETFDEPSNQPTSEPEDEGDEGDRGQQTSFVD
ncbi:MAG: hypothetical protein WEB85_07910 [Dongiaceae bacterium]